MVGNQFTQSWGYVALQLDAAAPPLILVNQRLAPRSPRSRPVRSNQLAVNFRRTWVVWTLVLAGGGVAGGASIILAALR